MIFKIQGLFEDIPKFSLKIQGPFKDLKDQHEIQEFQGFFQVCGYPVNCSE